MRQHDLRCLLSVGFLRANQWYVRLPQVVGLALLLAVIGFLTSDRSLANADGLRGDWQSAYMSRSRLLAGTVKHPSGENAHYAGVQLELAPKWKTYWRSPGEAGGVPPTFDWTGSKNVKQVSVEYPAPVRMDSGYGANIGYHGHVTFPVRFEVVDPEKASELNVDFQYGTCEDICVPSSVKLSLQIPPGNLAPAPTVLSNAVKHVPNLAPLLQVNDPRLLTWKVELNGKKPHIKLDIDYGSDAVSADVFVEGPGGLFIPMSQRVAKTNLAAGTKRFWIDLSKDVDLAEIKGKPLRVTIVGDAGRSEYEILAK
ncbi:MAG: protein-disulfide reductase DsbD domain-containing protein [Hyphomicrobiaceae bacterium]